MSAKRFVSVLAPSGLVGLAVGALASAHHGPTTPFNQRAARIAAKHLLAELRRPAGAIRARFDPSGSALEKPATITATPDLVDLHQFWRVGGDPQAVFSWLKAHRPSASKLSLYGTATATDQLWFLGFSFLGVLGGAPSETLVEEVAPAAGGGTALRADAEVVWYLRRPAWERIPAGVTAVNVTVRRFGRTTSSQTVTDPAKVRRIVTLVDQLPRAQPGASSCPADRGPVVVVDFRPAPNATPVATATADGSGCGLVRFQLRGRAASTLSGGPGLIRQLQSLLGGSLG